MKCDLSDEKKIGPLIRSADLEIKRTVYLCIRNTGLDKVTAANGYILHYLSENADKDVFQKNMETEFNIGKSAVTSILNLMENKGYIARSSVDRDARLKKITLTEKGAEVNRCIEKNIAYANSRLLDGISQDDYLCFAGVIKKICENAVKIRSSADGFAADGTEK